jgi:hypothetical protein
VMVVAVTATTNGEIMMNATIIIDKNVTVVSVAVLLHH